VATRAGNAGLDVILDMHNFGAYYLYRDGQGVRCSIGETACSISAFAGVWRSIAKVFKSHPAVVGYTIMTEPVGLQPQGSLTPADVWRQASQAAVNAIRSTRDANLLMINGYPWAGVRRWVQNNPQPWITDPAGQFMYEGHHYWSQEPKYQWTYAEEVAYAQARGW
jgi:endoglucanase